MRRPALCVDEKRRNDWEGSSFPVPIGLDDNEQGDDGVGLRQRPAREHPDARKRPVFGVELHSLLSHSDAPRDPQVPFIMVRLCTFIEEQGLRIQGLFRIAGSYERVQQLRQAFDDHTDVTLTEEIDVPAAVSLLKLFLHELPQPVIPPVLNATFVAIWKDCCANHVLFIKRLRALLGSMPVINYNTLKYFCGFLNRVSKYQVHNMASASLLAGLFGPDFFRVCGGSHERVATNRVFVHLISTYEETFLRGPQDNPRSLPICVEVHRDDRGGAASRGRLAPGPSSLSREAQECRQRADDEDCPERWRYSGRFESFPRSPKGSRHFLLRDSAFPETALFRSQGNLHSLAGEREQDLQAAAFAEALPVPCGGGEQGGARGPSSSSSLTWPFDFSSDEEPVVSRKLRSYVENYAQGGEELLSSKAFAAPSRGLRKKGVVDCCGEQRQLSKKRSHSGRLQQRRPSEEEEDLDLQTEYRLAKLDRLEELRPRRVLGPVRREWGGREGAWQRLRALASPVRSSPGSSRLLQKREKKGRRAAGLPEDDGDHLSGSACEHFRSIKRALLRTAAAAAAAEEAADELEPILENVAMDFTLASPRHGSRRRGAGAARSPSSERSATSATWSRNIHSLSLDELLSEQYLAKEEKKRLRRILREYEDAFYQIHGRVAQKEDRDGLEEMYSMYRLVKSRLRLLEALISKQERASRAFT